MGQPILEPVGDPPVTKPIKAIYAAVITLLGGVGTAASTGADALTDVATWCVILLTTVVAAGGVYGLRNPTVGE